MKRLLSGPIQSKVGANSETTDLSVLGRPRHEGDYPAVSLSRSGRAHHPFPKLQPATITT